MRPAQPKEGKERHALMGQHRPRPSSATEFRALSQDLLKQADGDPSDKSELAAAFRSQWTDPVNGGQSPKLWLQCQPIAAAL